MEITLSNATMREREEDNDIQKKSSLSHLSSYVFDEPRLYIFDGESCSCSQKMQRYRHAIAIAQALRLITPIAHILKGSLLFNGWISTYHESKCLPILLP